jgi:hypothetical protein
MKEIVSFGALDFDEGMLTDLPFRGKSSEDGCQNTESPAAQWKFKLKQH